MSQKRAGNFLHFKNYKTLRVMCYDSAVWHLEQVCRVASRCPAAPPGAMGHWSNQTPRQRLSDGAFRGSKVIGEQLAGWKFHL